MRKENKLLLKEENRSEYELYCTLPSRPEASGHRDNTGLRGPARHNVMNNRMKSVSVFNSSNLQFYAIK